MTIKCPLCDEQMGGDQLSRSNVMRVEVSGIIEVLPLDDVRGIQMTKTDKQGRTGSDVDGPQTSPANLKD